MKTCKIPNLGRFVNSLAVCCALSVISCQDLGTSSLKETTSTFKVAIGEDAPGVFKMLVSAPGSRSTFGICNFPVEQLGDCAPTHPTYKEVLFERATGERSIYKYPAPVSLEQKQTFVAVDAAGKTLRKFTFSDKASPESPGESSLDTALALIQEETLREELTYLTRDEWQGRLTGSRHNNEVADWLISHLKKLNVQPGVGSSYKQPFQFSMPELGNIQSQNIIGVFPGNDPVLKNEYIVIGAHMDHAGTLSRGFTCSSSPTGNNICNGADDNGSGTIGLLNITKALASIRTQLKRSVIVMWFAGEEEGLKGSYHYVNNPTVSLDQIKIMINLDMIGYLRQNGNTLLAIGTDNKKPAYKIAEKIVTSKFQSVRLRGSQNAQGGSDHAPFMGKGIPAIFFHTGVSSNPNYHKTSDTPDKIDYQGMAQVSKIALESLYTLTNQAGNAGFSLTSDGPRQSLLPPSELDKSCHHLIFVEKDILSQLDFTNGNDGGLKERRATH